jgi:acyl transferase domain-containing protein/glutamate-1-semialdehyde aminotransferase
MAHSELGGLVGSVAIIGMGGRFPGARNLSEFWENLRAGVVSISRFTDEELAAWGVDVAGLRAGGAIVPARGILPDLEMFDADFFGIPRVEAEVIDPQHRIFLETAWEALESAGYDPEACAGSIGVYGGAGRNAYFVYNLLGRPDVLDRAGALRVSMGNEKDYLTTRVSYKLNLRGPSVNVSNTCATSLVAVCLAHQALVSYQCDMALAGGVSVDLPQHRWYRFRDGGVASPDGQCRAFDAKGQGTVFGDGVGIVVLKRLADALADGDCIHAVIRGTAVNNDGSAKVGFAAPSVDGQAQVIAMAQADADVSPDTISYVEAHGTATPLGDPIEVAALTQAFRAGTAASGFCAIGSVKTNLGHLDAAAGVAGLIKTVLSLEHRMLPASLHFEEPNPKIDFAGSPFYVNTELKPWKRGSTPLRAGVSSFGTGSTNAHVVLEEAPHVGPSGPSRPRQLLLMSARSDAALDQMTAALAEHLRAHPEQPLADVAYTLQTGRRAFAHRRMLVGCTGEDAATELCATGSRRVLSSVVAGSRSRVAFMFPGQGAQYVGMGHGLYLGEAIFRAQLDRCAELLEPHLGLDLRKVLYPDQGDRTEAERCLAQTAITQPAVFAVEYALAQLFASWGIQPSTMIGHSIGEYTAACLAGVFTLPDALGLVAARGRLMQEQPGGAMLAVNLPADEIESLLDGSLSIAAINAPARCVVAGPETGIEAFAVRLADRGVASRRLQTSHAFHSPMMEAVVDRFAALVDATPRVLPSAPWMSSMTGDWITPTEALDPCYWARQVTEPVRFSAGLSRLLATPGLVLLEVGPGHALSAFAKQHTEGGGASVAVASLPASRSAGDDLETVLEAVGRLWLADLTPDWSGFYRTESRRRVPLPTYPFQRQRFWVDPVRTVQQTNTLPGDACSAGREPIVAACPTAAKLSEETLTMPDATTAALPIDTRRNAIAARLQRTLGEVLGITIADADRSASLVELGFDSLVLTQVSLVIDKTFGVKVSFREFLEELDTIDKLAEHLDSVLPPAPPALLSTEAARRPGPPPTASGGTRPVVSVALPPQGHDGGRLGDSPPATLERIMAEQLRVMAQQLEVLRECAASEAAVPAGDEPAGASKPRIESASPVPSNGAGVAGQINGTSASAGVGPTPRAPSELPRFGPFKPIQKGSLSGLSPVQRAYLDDLIARYVARTAGSKAITAKHRGHLADPRAVSGYKILWKEMVYPIAAVRSQGSRIWDVDGNEYVDLVLGFGANFLGHRPPCVMAALEEQLRLGFEVGPQSPLAGTVAEMICELTGMDRAAFCNTGSEAVMAAVRAARTVTGRDRIVFFSGDYHGNYDEVLARGGVADGRPRAFPIAPGIPANLLDNVTVLQYGSPDSVQYVRQHGSELAAVLVEPIQGRAPGASPREFLHGLRTATEETGTALIFDEIVTGFRVHQRGAQGLFDLKADLATYGKVIGGGLPLGILAGARRFMDALDGGDWRYGDASSPEVGVTFFAGTFVRHPLALAAARAVLAHLKEQGPALQDALNERTGRLVRSLNRAFEEAQAPLKAQHFQPGSWFYIEVPPDLPLASLLFYHLRERGVHLYEGRAALLSTAHTDEDTALVLAAFKETVAEMQRGGALLGRAPAAPPVPGARLGKDPAGRPAWFVADPARPGNYLQVEVHA